jgi:hypothetical protein
MRVRRGLVGIATRFIVAVLAFTITAEGSNAAATSLKTIVINGVPKTMSDATAQQLLAGNLTAIPPSELRSLGLNPTDGPTSKAAFT